LSSTSVWHMTWCSRPLPAKYVRAVITKEFYCKISSQYCYCKNENSPKEQKYFLPLMTLIYLGFLQRTPVLHFLAMSEFKTFCVAQTKIRKKPSRHKKIQISYFCFLKIYIPAPSLICPPKNLIPIEESTFYLPADK